VLVADADKDADAIAAQAADGVESSTETKSVVMRV